MGRSTSSDICNHVARLERRDIYLLPADVHAGRLVGGWEHVWDGADVGRRKRLYAHGYLKIADGKTYTIGLINESEYEAGGGADYAIIGFTPEESSQMLVDWVALAAEYDLPPVQIPVPLATAEESISLLCQDLGESPEILETDSVQQTL